MSNKIEKRRIPIDLSKEVSKVYYAVTGGKIKNPFTFHPFVISKFEDYIDKLINKETKNIQENFDRLKTQHDLKEDEIKELKKEIKQFKEEKKNLVEKIRSLKKKLNPKFRFMNS